jgi:xanthine dehydrogenase YagS FAD-binding subunit
MKPFTYVRATDTDRALAAGRDPGASYLAGGTTLVDLMRLGVMAPATVVDVNPLPLAGIEPDGDGLRLGAMARNSDVAYHPLVASRYPVLSQALLAGASPQLRNMATVGGNLLQRTRCPYFRDPASPCNKRDPGSGCPAWDGYNRSNAVLGGSEQCIATHPSDMCVALVALDAVVHTRGPRGERTVGVEDFHVLPAGRPDMETVLEPGELVMHVTLPASPFAARSAYVKVRDRASFAFALASAAVALEVQGGVIQTVRVALGGIATKPWRSREAEAVLVGRAPGAALFKQAAEAALRGAVPRKGNAFKVELARRTLVRALTRVGGAA